MYEDPPFPLALNGTFSIKRFDEDPLRLILVADLVRLLHSLKSEWAFLYLEFPLWTSAAITVSSVELEEYWSLNIFGIYSNYLLSPVFLLTGNFKLLIFPSGSSNGSGIGEPLFLRLYCDGVIFKSPPMK